MAVTSNIIAYYRFDVGANDPVGLYNGTEINTPTYTSGKINNAVTLSSSSSQYLTFPQNTIPYGTNTLTINLWLKLASTSGNQAIIFSARTNQGIAFYKSGTNTITFSKPNVVDLNYTWTGIDTSWHMWTLEADGSGMRIYLDGNSTPVASNANTSNFVAPSTDPTSLGAYLLSNSPQASWYLDGQVDMLVFYSDAKSTTDISTLYNSGAGNDFLVNLNLTMEKVDFSFTLFDSIFFKGLHYILSSAYGAFNLTGYTLSFILDLYTRVTNRVKHATTVTNRSKTASASVTNRVKNATTVTNRPKS